MDSITILATISTLSNVLQKLGRTISTIAELQRNWRDPDVTVVSLENQLWTLRTALGQIRDWLQKYPELHHQLVMDLDRCVACCRLLMTKVNADVAQLRQMGDRPGRLTLMLKTRNLKKTQAMIQQQTTALSLLLTACNSAALWQQKELLEMPQTRRVFRAMEEDTSSLFVHRDVDSILTSASSQSTPSSASTFGGASIRSLKFDFDNQLFVSKIYERWIKGSSSKKPLPPDQQTQQSEINIQYPPASYPTQSYPAQYYPQQQQHITHIDHKADRGDKLTAQGNMWDGLEAGRKFNILPAVLNDDKFTVSHTGPVETREKFLAMPVETDEKFIVGGTVTTGDNTAVVFPDDAAVRANLGGLLTPKRASTLSIKNRFRLMSPVREKSDSQKRSLAIDNALRDESRRMKMHHDHKVLVIGSESRWHILTAARMREKQRAEGGGGNNSGGGGGGGGGVFTSSDLDGQRNLVFRKVRECAHVLVKEMRRVQINPDARYLWAYVDLIEGYFHDPGPGMDLDQRFFNALEAILQDPLIINMVRRSSSSSSPSIWPRSAEYLLASVPRIARPDYAPTELDVVHAQTNSTTGGIDKAAVREGDLSVDLVDIGGMTGKRGKWIHHFDGVRFVVLVVDLDRRTAEEGMADTLPFLDAVVRSRWFAAASVILLLNVRGGGYGHRVHGSSTATGSATPTPTAATASTYSTTAYVNGGGGAVGVGNNMADVRSAAEYLLGTFHELNLRRLFVSPCDVMADGEAALRFVLAAVKEAMLTEALGEGNTWV